MKEKQANYLLYMHTSLHIVVVQNNCEDAGDRKFEGTQIIVIDKYSAMAKETGKDTIELGRWFWII